MSQQLKSLIAPYLKEIESGLMAVLDRNMPTLLHEPIRYFFSMPGKRVRPLFTLLVAEHRLGDWRAALPAAVAIEILHDFTLIHDDIMDEDSFRRGFETVHRKWDVSTALLAGDAMVSLAYNCLLKTETPHLLEMIRQFTDGMYVVCAGQALDKEFEKRDDVTLPEYLLMIRQKTARLIALSFQLGYLTGNTATDELEIYTRIGENIGLAFQIQDDLLDYIGNQKELGKDVGSDWRQRKQSYVAVKYREFREKNPAYPPLFGYPSFQEALHALHNIGLIDQIRTVVDSYLNEARNLAAKVKLHHPVFMEFIHFLQNRNY